MVAMAIAVGGITLGQTSLPAQAQAYPNVDCRNPYYYQYCLAYHQWYMTYYAPYYYAPYAYGYPDYDYGFGYGFPVGVGIGLGFGGFHHGFRGHGHGGFHGGGHGGRRGGGHGGGHHH
jgi:hypothetical protein